MTHAPLPPATSSGIPQIVERSWLFAHRRRAHRSLKSAASIDALYDLVAGELQDRLAFVNRAFTRIAVIGWQADRLIAKLGWTATAIEDAEILDLAPQNYDLIIYGPDLHWHNDPLGQLIQIHRALQADGMMLAMGFCGQSLHELRSVLAEAEQQVEGGLSPRVLPMADVRAWGQLLQRAGFAMPVADMLPLTLSYRSLTALAHELRYCGEANAMRQQRGWMSRSMWACAEALYKAHFSDPADPSRIKASIELAILTGWAPSPDQARPLRPGSAAMRLADALNTDEKPLP